MGTPEFACVSLRKLFDEGYNITSVVTTEDKPRGRGHKMTHPDVYVCAEELGIKNIYQPINLKKENFENILLNENPDVIVVVAYGKLLPEYVIKFPRYGCINVHGSLLPKYRGAAPMQWCLIDGESETGVTTMYMDKGLDTGDMLLKSAIPLTLEDNFGTVHDKLSVLGANLLVETLSKLEKGEVQRVPQGETTTHYAQMITKEMCKIEWRKKALDICNLIRGLTPFPKATSIFEDKALKITKALPIDSTSDKVPGQIIAVNKDSFDVCCGESTVLRIFEIQPEAKKVMSVEDYLKGNKIEVNTVLS